MHPNSPSKSSSAIDSSESKLKERKSPLEKDGAEINAFPSLSILGICGSIGTGKSYACSLLTTKINESTDDNNEAISSADTVSSAYHIDTDSLAHGVYSPGSKAIDEIEEEFGSDVVEISEIENDGATSSSKTVNRKNLGAIVFSDRSKMAVSVFTL